MDLFGRKAKLRQQYLRELEIKYCWCGIHNCELKPDKDFMRLRCEQCEETEKHKKAERKEFLLREVGGAW